MSKIFQLKLTSAVALNGEIRRAGDVVEVPELVAKDLLRRGKAEADASVPADEPEAAAPEASQEDQPEPEAAAPVKKAKAK